MKSLTVTIQDTGEILCHFQGEWAGRDILLVQRRVHKEYRRYQGEKRRRERVDGEWRGVDSKNSTSSDLQENPETQKKDTTSPTPLEDSLLKRLEAMRDRNPQGANAPQK